jgi:hypothetical protein
MGMHNNMSQLVQMNFLSIFLRSSSVILVPGMTEEKASATKRKTRLSRIRPQRALLPYITTDKVNI